MGYPITHLNHINPIVRKTPTSFSAALNHCHYVEQLDFKIWIYPFWEYLIVYSLSFWPDRIFWSPSMFSNITAVPPKLFYVISGLISHCSHCYTLFIHTVRILVLRTDHALSQSESLHMLFCNTFPLFPSTNLLFKAQPRCHFFQDFYYWVRFLTFEVSQYSVYMVKPQHLPNNFMIVYILF